MPAMLNTMLVLMLMSYATTTLVVDRIVTNKGVHLLPGLFLKVKRITEKHRHVANCLSIRLVKGYCRHWLELLTWATTLTFMVIRKPTHQYRSNIATSSTCIYTVGLLPYGLIFFTSFVYEPASYPFLV